MHRDIQPSNVLAFENDHLKLHDFGLSKVMEYHMHGRTMSHAGVVGYMAPEVGESEYTNKADIYSLGAVLYFMTHDAKTPKV